MKPALLALFTLGAFGCKQEPNITIIGMPGASASVRPPIDHLAPGELLEGDAKAFGLVLPRGAKIDHPFVDVVYASGPMPPDALATYVRARVRDGKVTAGATGTVFDKVRVSAIPDHELAIDIHPGDGGRGSKIEIRDVTPTKGPDLPDEAARWRAAGLKPNGQVLDPTHLQ